MAKRIVNSTLTEATRERLPAPTSIPIADTFALDFVSKLQGLNYLGMIYKNITSGAKVRYYMSWGIDPNDSTRIFLDFFVDIRRPKPGQDYDKLSTLNFSWVFNQEYNLIESNITSNRFIDDPRNSIFDADYYKSQIPTAEIQFINTLATQFAMTQLTSLIKSYSMVYQTYSTFLEQFTPDVRYYSFNIE